jgi:glycosyltransferase involved in cell wall biosynthesis
VREVLQEGITGFIVRNIDEAADAIGRLPRLSRARIRREFERRFSASRMADDYLQIYEDIIREGAATRPMTGVVHHD